MVHSCSPGFLEVGDGDNATCIEDPSWGWGGGPGPVGGERVPSGGGGGGGGGGLPVLYGTTHDVFIVYATLRGTVCQMVCAVTSIVVCAAVGATCPVASVVTIGGLAIPCTAALIAACGSMAAAQAICSTSCPK